MKNIHSLIALTAISFFSCGEDSTAPNTPLSSSGTSSVLNSSSSLTTPSSSSLTNLLSSSIEISSSSSSSFLALSSSIPSTNGELTDSRDGQIYPTIKIGTQVWMAKNLNFGTLIQRVGTWKLGANQKICYNNTESFCEQYGAYYDWSTALALPDSCDTTLCAQQMQAKHQGICPVGSHLPTYEEWRILFSYLEKGTPGASGAPGAWDAGAKLKAQFTGFSEWDDIKTNLGFVTNFNAQPNPWFTGSFFGPKGTTAAFLSAYEKSERVGDDIMISAGSKSITRSGSSKSSLYQIRCLLD